MCEKGFDPAQNSFVQSYGSTSLDASLLLIAMVGFLPASDLAYPRYPGRYRKGPGSTRLCPALSHQRRRRWTYPPGEGVFLACSFWLADNYVLQGRLDDARTLFERLLSLRNDVGLLAEEYDPSDAGNWAIFRKPSRILR